MAGALKHEKRSHKTANRNYSQFRGFVAKVKSDNKAKTEKKNIFARIARFFKHQDK